MAFDVWKKIESIRQQPEHIRMRYVIGCLIVSMIFISGIWLLSIGESFQSISKEVPVVGEKGRQLLPKGETPSLSGLLEKATPLRVDGQAGKTETKDYLNEQLEKSTQSTNEEPLATP